LGLLKRPFQPEEREKDIRETVIREDAKKQEDENHSIEELIPQGGQHACRCLDR